MRSGSLVYQSNEFFQLRFHHLHGVAKSNGSSKRDEDNKEIICHVVTRKKLISTKDLSIVYERFWCKNAVEQMFEKQIVQRLSMASN